MAAQQGDATDGHSGRHPLAGDPLQVRRVLLEFAHTVLARAIEPVPAGVRTLDALQLASVLFLRAAEDFPLEISGE